MPTSGGAEPNPVSGETVAASPAEAPSPAVSVVAGGKPARKTRVRDPYPGPAPFVPKSPGMAACYIAAAVLISLTQGLGLNFVTANLNQLSGSLGATTNEASWLLAAYLVPNVSLTLLLTKLRAQFGLRHFAEVAIIVFVAVSLAHLWVDDLRSALVVRFFAGVAASPMSSLGFLFMLESFPPAKKMTVGICLALANIGMAVPAARLISPYLLDLGDWQALYVAEAALALMSFAAIYMLPLASPPRAKVIEPLDFVSYGFIAVGLGSLAVVLSLGRLYWWFEAPWLGVLLAVSAATLTVAVIIELNRENPLLDIRWLASKEILRFAGALMIFRFVLAEQTTGATGFFQALGLMNEQMAGLFWVILASGVAGSLACALVISPKREAAIHAVALVLLIIGATMDARATNLTRPDQMFLSQALIAFAGGLFLPPAVASGLMSALTKGPSYILSFIIVFLTTQNMGGLLGSAAFGTFVTIREKFHSHQLVESIVLTDPVVAARVAQLGAAYGKVLNDPALRNAEGLALLASQATREATVLAYNDTFLLIAAVAALALACLLIHVALRAILARTAPAAAPTTA